MNTNQTPPPDSLGSPSGSPRFEQFAGFLVPEGHAVFGGMTVHPIIDRETCGPIDGYPKESQWFAVAFSATDQEEIAAALNGENNASRDGCIKSATGEV